MRIRRALAPAALVVVAAVGGGLATAQELDARATADPLGGARAATPVLSVRRLPSVVAEPIAARRLRADLATWAATAPAPSCATVLDPEGEVALDHRGAEALVPASTTKLLTAAAAIELLGPEHRYRTPLLGPAPADGSVPGDVVLVGAGDPLLASPDYVARFERQPQVHTDLDQLAASIAGQGIRRIEGSVVGDEGRYDRERYVPGWPARYIDQDQIGPMSALAVNDGFAQYPTREQWRELVPAADPAAEAAAVLTRLLEARGVEVVGPPRAGAAVAGQVELAAIESPPLLEVVRELLQESDNGTAELLLKELGQRAGDPSTAGGRAQVLAALGAAGFDLAGIVLDDGSGLSTTNRVPCYLLLDLLADPDLGPALVERLAVAGRSGTLAEAFVGTSLEGVLRAKTGSLNAVAALAGHVDDGDGPLLFAFVVNDPDGRVDEAAASASQAALGQVLLSWPRTPSLDALGPLEPDDR